MGMKILHVLAPAPFGGLERVVQDLTRAQAGAGHDVRVVAVGQVESDVGPFLASLAGEVEVRPLLLPVRAYLRERKTVEEICREWGADVRHTHGYRADVVHAGAGGGSRPGTVSTVHGFTTSGATTGHPLTVGTVKNRLYEWLQCRAYRRVGAAVAVSRALSRDLRSRGVPPERLHVIPNALAEPDLLERNEAREALEVDAAAFHVGWVGRLGPEKGPDVFLEALRRMDALERCRVTIMGSGSLEGELRRFSAEHGLEPSVRFLGPVEGAVRLFRGFDLLVMSSRTEGTPIVLLEAMAAGTPLVTTAVGGIPDVVSDREALLVPSDHPQALARAMEAVFHDPEGARERARRARARFERDRSPSDWVERYDEVYEEVRSKSRP
jgi:glycosyltransferase involved in cell wall biosynthesis